MRRYVFGIASYNRLKKQNCLRWLHSLGVSKRDIYLQTQTEKDYKEYARDFGDVARVDYAPASNCAGNKNNLLERIAESDDARDSNVVLCSDNVGALLTLGAPGERLAAVDDPRALGAILDRCFQRLDAYGAAFFGVYPCPNAFFMSHTMTVDTWVIGCFCGFSWAAARSLRFDVRYSLKDDYEICARVVSGGGRVLRFNDLAVRKAFRTRGGSFEYWHSQDDAENRKCADALALTYPDFFRRHKTRINEVETVGKREIVDL